MIDPCRECSLLMADKNTESCLKCDRRIQYVERIGGMTHSVPVEMSDMRMNRKETKEHDEFILANPDMKPSEIAKQRGCSTSAIYTRRHVLKRRLRSGVEDNAPAGTGIPTSAGLEITNFTIHDDLYERLKQCAKRNFRTPEMQAMWFIHQGLAAENGA